MAVSKYKIDDKYSAEFLWTDELGSYNQTAVDINNIENELERFAAELYKLIEENARAAELVNTGSLLDPSNFKTTITEDGKGKQTLEIGMVYYADYVNRGVMGFKSKKPDSPYKFMDNFSMSDEGRESIKNWVKNNRDIKLDKTKKEIVGLERKEGNFMSKKKLTKSELEKKTDAMISAIKSGGIKRTDYFTNAAKVAIDNLKKSLGKAVLKDIKIELILNNNKKNVRI